MMKYFKKNNFVDASVVRSDYWLAASLYIIYVYIYFYDKK